MPIFQASIAEFLGSLFFFWKPQPTPNRDRFYNFLMEVNKIACQFELEGVSGFPTTHQQARTLAGMVFELRREVTLGEITDMLRSTEPEEGGISFVSRNQFFSITAYGKSLRLK